MIAPPRVAATLAAALLVVAQGLPASAGLAVLDARGGDGLITASTILNGRAVDPLGYLPP